MFDDSAQTFAAALQELEISKDVGRFVSACFADNVKLLRPETGQQEQGSTGAHQFWQQYLDQFRDIRSEFHRVVDGQISVLEWTSTGQLRNGSDISYHGVSLLDHDDDGRVTRFATYYDTTPFNPDRQTNL